MPKDWAERFAGSLSILRRKAAAALRAWNGSERTRRPVVAALLKVLHLLRAARDKGSVGRVEQYHVGNEYEQWLTWYERTRSAKDPPAVSIFEELPDQWREGVANATRSLRGAGRRKIEAPPHDTDAALAQPEPPQLYESVGVLVGKIWGELDIEWLSQEQPTGENLAELDTSLT